ncbi:hypothetical protein E2C01_001544 [Portunus trituberculatus]|uniref:Uncharacterized protein n=1 Tax=Portunus trituberculatus TaxID=210409 RepID=A0A5B7CI80_PORTR|nr:hypothetical protein [Portunus trituberculatus]
MTGRPPECMEPLRVSPTTRCPTWYGKALHLRSCQNPSKGQGRPGDQQTSRFLSPAPKLSQLAEASLVYLTTSPASSSSISDSRDEISSPSIQLHRHAVCKLSIAPELSVSFTLVSDSAGASWLTTGRFIFSVTSSYPPPPPPSPRKAYISFPHLPPVHGLPFITLQFTMHEFGSQEESHLYLRKLVMCT